MLVFSEDFGSLPDGTTITTSNTAFDYVRVGSGGGSIEAINPGSFAGASLSLGGSTSGSLNGVGLSAGLGAPGLVVLEMSFTTADASEGDLFVGAGTGSSFSGNGTFNTSQFFFGLQFNNGNVEYRTTGWNNVGFTLQDNTLYDLSIVANDTGAEVDYSGGEVPTGNMDILLNDVVIADNVALTGNQAANGFRIYQTNGGQVFEIDNLAVSNAIAAIPEPSPFLFGSLLTGALVGLTAGRRRRVA